uniref:Phosphomevalonate kinase n=1 Tax=Ditylenchus dipsaci TaxID=166011 RepID=A0A915EB40_9BILA
MFDSVAMSNSVCSIIKPPSLLICISGKRKSGKDFVASSLKRILHQNFLSSFPQQTGHYKAVKISSCGISHLLKENFANIHGLDAEKLKTDGVYKELVRQKMVKYGRTYGLRIQDSFAEELCKVYVAPPNPPVTTHFNLLPI